MTTNCHTQWDVPLGVVVVVSPLGEPEVQVFEPRPHPILHYYQIGVEDHRRGVSTLWAWI